ncbi:N-acetylglucosamine-6-phosphate deacetylase [Agrobacterium tumefaciens]|nr:N-acetylglucosamine-6-phosphate deacetylase [Agrobacterium tumefaciens]
MGAALSNGKLDCGLIADGFHVDPAAIGIALRAKNSPGRIFLVTDAMSTIGTDDDGFELNGRRVYRNGGRLTLEDGTLAGRISICSPASASCMKSWTHRWKRP